ncbi:helix-turn-helix domain-containing protein [Vulgatibacter sp.]|uniref:helix-turn-helix domain-containing protein n=1 Tax=Vulgatibacter sp. TaxID=1971226 RepID=UPI0035680366
MTETDLTETEALAERLRSADVGELAPEVARDFRELLEDVPWLVAEIRRLRLGPGRLGALLRHRRVEKGLAVEQVAREASLQPAAGSVAISPEEVRALEEGIHPTGPRWPDILRAIAAVLGIPAADLPPA